MPDSASVPAPVLSSVPTKAGDPGWVSMIAPVTSSRAPVPTSKFCVRLPVAVPNAEASASREEIVPARPVPVVAIFELTTPLVISDCEPEPVPETTAPPPSVRLPMYSMLVCIANVPPLIEIGVASGMQFSTFI